MKKNIVFFFLLLQVFHSYAQTQIFDITTYTEPKGWKADKKDNVIIYSYTDNKKKTWCQIGIYKSTVSKGTIEKDFVSEWNDLAIKQYKATGLKENEVITAEGWTFKAGVGNFRFNNADAIVMLTTMTGYQVCVSILAITNSQDYLKDIQNLLESVDLKKLLNQPTGNLATKTPVSQNTQPGNKANFAFTTTNFDDGWTSSVQEDFVSVVKGKIKVMIHYPNKKADAYNSVLKEEDYNAWNTLVAPRYSNLQHLEWRSIQSWQSITFMEGDAKENATGNTVHIVLFKKHYSSGMGGYLEFVTDNKAIYENEFGAYHNTESDWDKIANMQFRNKFAVGASDLKGKWTNNFSGLTQYVNANTGANAGADTHASNQNFEFGTGNTYKWDLTVANGFVGNIKFQNVKSSGKFLLPNNWQVNFSDMEGKPKKYNAYFSCIKGARILWLQDTGYGDYTGFGKSE